MGISNRKRAPNSGRQPRKLAVDAGLLECSDINPALGDDNDIQTDQCSSVASIKLTDQPFESVSLRGGSDFFAHGDSEPALGISRQGIDQKTPGSETLPVCVTGQKLRSFGKPDGLGKI